MQELRLVLIIVGALAISALLLHGLWTSRKEKPAKFGEKPLGKLGDTNNVDTDGFDQDGVGSVRVVNTGPEEAEKKAHKRTEPELHFGEKLQADPLLDVACNASFVDDLPKMSATAEKIEPQASIDTYQSETEAMPVEPQGPAEPVQVVKAEPATADTALSSAALSERPDAEPNSGAEAQPVVADSSDEVAEVIEPEEPAPSLVPMVEPEPVLEPSYLALSVHARNGEMLQGAKLFGCLEQHNLIFGDNAVYHRHADLAGVEPVLFSAANMIHPGNFPEGNEDNFETPGVSFYLMLPCYGRADQNFNLMLQTVQQIADELNADVLDHERTMITPNRIDAYREKAKLYTQI
ncbi:cell division protein ZipA [Photobacterium lipolyticum]|nr:cell division protein ZipA [Photobacterium lipolyticum]